MNCEQALMVHKALTLWERSGAIVRSDTPSILGSLASFWSDGRLVERVGYLVGALLLISGLIHLAIVNIGGGSWYGRLSFRKPATFGLRCRHGEVCRLTSTW